jgi:hypothetical protein
MMYDFCVCKHEVELAVLWSYMKVNAYHLDTELKKADIEKNNVRQSLDSVSRDLNAKRQNHNALKKHAITMGMTTICERSRARIQHEWEE